MSMFSPFARSGPAHRARAGLLALMTGVTALLSACGGGSGDDAAAGVPQCETMAHPQPCPKPTQAASLSLRQVNTTNIALRGTGGIGRQEFSTLTFTVHDASGALVSGQAVDFVFADTGTATSAAGATLTPAAAVSGYDGMVQVTVSAGMQPTSVRVAASLRDKGISTLSDVLVVSSGVVSAQRLSMSASRYACEGVRFDASCATLTVTAADHFGNPAPDGTAISFTTEGGMIHGSCITGTAGAPTTPSGQSTNSTVGGVPGQCSVTLHSSEPRPADGRVTVTAFLLGEEGFFDANGNNACDHCDTLAGLEFTSQHDLSPDIFRDDNEDGVWTPGEPCIGPNLSGQCNTPGDGRYNGVLRAPRYGAGQTTYVQRSAVIYFGTSRALIQVSPEPVICPVGGNTEVSVRVSDERGAPMVGGTEVKWTAALNGQMLNALPAKADLPEVIQPMGAAPLASLLKTVVTCGTTTGSGSFTVQARTPKGVVTEKTVVLKVQ